MVGHQDKPDSIETDEFIEKDGVYYRVVKAPEEAKVAEVRAETVKPKEDLIARAKSTAAKMFGVRNPTRR